MDGKDGSYQYRDMEGAILNWWPSTKKVTFQGNGEAKKRLEAALEGAASPRPAPGSGAPAAASSVKKRQIFVVHGHDKDTRDQLELVLHRLSLDPHILVNSSGEGKTIIEALEGKIGKDYSSDFGIVLFTPDDFGFAKADGEAKKEPRARQNVILEAGMLLSSLTRSRIALLMKGHVELPSDLQGVIQLRFNDHIREIVPKLCDRLREAGIDISNDSITAAMA